MDELFFSLLFVLFAIVLSYRLFLWLKSRLKEGMVCHFRDFAKKNNLAYSEINQFFYYYPVVSGNYRNRKVDITTGYFIVRRSLSGVRVNLSVECSSSTRVLVIYDKLKGNLTKDDFKGLEEIFVSDSNIQVFSDSPETAEQFYESNRDKFLEWFSVCNFHVDIRGSKIQIEMQAVPGWKKGSYGFNEINLELEDLEKSVDLLCDLAEAFEKSL